MARHLLIDFPLEKSTKNDPLLSKIVTKQKELGSSLRCEKQKESYLNLAGVITRL